MAFLCIPLLTNIHARNLLPNTVVQVLGPSTADVYAQLDPKSLVAQHLKQVNSAL